MRSSLACIVLFSLTSCAILDYPMSIFDEETGETTEVALGDIVAASADPVSDTVATTVTGLTGGNGLLGAAAGAAAAALLGGAARRRKKKAEEVTEESPAPEEA